MRTCPALRFAAAFFLGLSASCRTSSESTTASTGPSLPAGEDTVVMGQLAGQSDGEEIPVTVTADRHSATFLNGDDFEVVAWDGKSVAAGDRVYVSEHYSVRVRFPNATFEGDAVIAPTKSK